jgi:hypothetical protein
MADEADIIAQVYQILFAGSHKSNSSNSSIETETMVIK